MQSESGPVRLQNTPRFLEELHTADDAAVIHIPLVVHGAERLDLVHQTVDAAAEIQWPQWVSLLHSATGIKSQYYGRKIALFSLRSTTVSNYSSPGTSLLLRP